MRPSSARHTNNTARDDSVSSLPLSLLLPAAYRRYSVRVLLKRYAYTNYKTSNVLLTRPRRPADRREQKGETDKAKAGH